jgi:hypothetical protein
MDIHDFKSLVEAYSQVYELDENRRMARDPEGRKSGHSKQPDPSKPGFTGIGNMSIDQIRKMSARIEKEKTQENEEYVGENRMASRGEEMPSEPAKPTGGKTHSIKDLSPSKEPTSKEKAKARNALGLGEATAMAKKGHDETAIRNKITANTKGGESADRATALADKPTYGQKGVDPKARQNLARKQRGDFRNTNSSNPGLKGYAHKSNDPDVKAKQAARGAQRGRAALTPNEIQQLNMGEATDYIKENIDIATEYFYQQGLNEYGIDILVEKLGDDEFCNFVFDIAEEYILTEQGRAAKRRTPSKSYDQVKAEIDAKDASKKQRKVAVKTAAVKQPEKEPVKQTLRDRISGYISKGIERHNAATATAGRLAKETGKTLSKAAKGAGHVAGQFGSGAGTVAKASKRAVVGEEVEEVDEKINLTTQSSKRKSLGKYKGEYESPKEFRKTEIKDAPYQSKGNYNAHLPKEEVELFDVVLEFLCVEGYAETLEEAEWLMANELDAEDIDSILNERKYDRDEKLPGSGKTPREKMERKRGQHAARVMLGNPALGRSPRNDPERDSYSDRARMMDRVKNSQDKGEEPKDDEGRKNLIKAARRPRASYEKENRPGGLRAGNTKAGGHRTIVKNN